MQKIRDSNKRYKTRYIKLSVTQISHRRNLLIRFCIAVGIDPDICIKTRHDGKLDIVVNKFETFQHIICILWTYMGEYKRKQAIDSMHTYRSFKTINAHIPIPKRDESGMSLLDILISKSE